VKLKGDFKEMKCSRDGFTPLEKMFNHLWWREKNNKFTQGLKSHPNIQTGFTLAELIITCAIIAIVSAVGVFTVNQQLPHYRLKGDSRTIASSLMLARMKATSSGVQHAIEFDLDTGRYTLQRGNASSGSTSWTDQPYERNLSFGVNIERVVNSGATSYSGIVKIVFNPIGSYDSTSAGQIRVGLGETNDGYRILLTRTTGRIQTIKGW